MFTIIFTLCLGIFAIQCNEIKKQIYYEIPNESVSHCVRRLNYTSSIGCSSESNGNVGIIEIAFNKTELNTKLKYLKENTILVISTSLFIKQNLTDIILKNRFVKGLVVFERHNCSDIFCNDANDSFSEDFQIPNQDFSSHNNHIYNPSGTKYAFQNWPLPVALIDIRHKVEQDKIIDCYSKFNINPQSTRKCSLEIRNFMAAVKSLETCLDFIKIQRKLIDHFHPVSFCRELSGENYVVHVFDQAKPTKPNPVIVLISRIDSLSMFERSAFNVHGTVTSASLLLSVMKLLMSQAEFRNQTNLKKNVLFLFLDNESYDYLGSDRFVWELNNNYLVNFTGVPVNFTNIDLLLEFGEMGFSNFSQTSFFYPIFTGKGKINNKTLNYFTKLWTYFQSFGFGSSYTNHDLPPASIQYFLRQQSIPSIVMSDHEESFKNRFYNSYLDSKYPNNISQELLAIVNSVASFVYQEATGKTLIQPMTELDDANPFSIINCFTNDVNCDLFKKVLPSTLIKDLYSLGTPIPTQEHSSKSEKYLSYRFSSLLENLITFFSGQIVNKTDCTRCPKCKNLTKLDHGNTSDCYLINYYISDKFYNTEKNSPLWSMSSIVDEQSVKMFVQGSNTPLLITGIVITIFMIIFMTLISSRMSEIFQSDC